MLVLEGLSAKGKSGDSTMSSPGRVVLTCRGLLNTTGLCLSSDWTVHTKPFTPEPGRWLLPSSAGRRRTAPFFGE